MLSTLEGLQKSIEYISIAKDPTTLMLTLGCMGAGIDILQTFYKRIRDDAR